MNDYSDIINLPHHVSCKHNHMSMSERAAQFSPFAALNGYEEAIRKVQEELQEQSAKGNIISLSL